MSHVPVLHPKEYWQEDPLGRRGLGWGKEEEVEPEPNPTPRDCGPGHVAQGEPTWAAIEGEENLLGSER